MLKLNLHTNSIARLHNVLEVSGQRDAGLRTGELEWLQCVQSYDPGGDGGPECFAVERAERDHFQTLDVAGC
jgi:hypothetical protein